METTKPKAIEYPKFQWDLVQNSDEWDISRMAMITASKVNCLLVNGKGENGFGTGAFTYLYQIVEQRVTGVLRQSFSSKATDLGHDQEDDAAESYEMETFVKTKRVGFVEKDKNRGCSPDRLIPEQSKGVEIKCFPTMHAEIFDRRVYERSIFVQCQYSLWVTGYKTWDLYFYHPLLPSIMFTLKPDIELFKTFETRTNLFIKMIEDRVKKYNNPTGGE